MTTNTTENGWVRLNNWRLSFPHLATPRPSRVMPDGSTTKSKYEASFLGAPTSQDVVNLMAVIRQLLAEKYKEHAEAALQKFMGDRKTRCFGPGEECTNSQTFQILDGYAGMFYINAKADISQKPKLYGPDGNPLMDASKLYGGCYVNAYVHPWIQTSQGGGIRCDLIAVQFDHDGPAFGAAPINTDGLFQPVPGAPAPVAPAPNFAPAPATPVAPFPPTGSTGGWTP